MMLPKGVPVLLKRCTLADLIVPVGTAMVGTTLLDLVTFFQHRLPHFYVACHFLQECLHSIGIRMKKMRAIIVIVMLALATGCSREKTTPPAGKANAPAANSAEATNPKDVKLQGLMRATFGKKFRPTSLDAFADLPDPENRQQINTYIVTPVATTALKNGTTVLVANAVQSDENGVAEVAHVTAGLLCIYFLQSENGQWKLIRKQENVASLGSFGNIGHVTWANLTEGRPGMVITNGGTWQGESIAFISIFDLTAGDITDLAAEPIALQSDNEGNCIAERDSCWNIVGTWEFKSGTGTNGYDDLMMHFSGKKAPSTSASDKSTVTEVDETATYAFDGKSYRLVSGRNPVPEI